MPIDINSDMKEFVKTASIVESYHLATTLLKHNIRWVRRLQELMSANHPESEEMLSDIRAYLDIAEYSVVDELMLTILLPRIEALQDLP